MHDRFATVVPPLLAVRHLTVTYQSRHGLVHAVTDMTFNVYPGETIGIVGESGSGKSTALRGLVRLLPPSSRISGEAILNGVDLIAMSPSQIRHVRGSQIGFVFQDPLRALDPLMAIGDQIDEAVREGGGTRSQARLRSIELLELVRLPDSRRRLGAYPQELSGGQRQRVCIAIALARRPQLLLADEPTSSLDVTIQHQVLRLLADLSHDLHMSVVLVSHDLGVVAQICQRVAVMYAGVIVEVGTSSTVLRRPAHPYTAGLLESVPRRSANGQGLTPIE